MDFSTGICIAIEVAAGRPIAIAVEVDPGVEFRHTADRVKDNLTGFNAVSASHPDMAELVENH